MLAFGTRTDEGKPPLAVCPKSFDRWKACQGEMSNQGSLVRHNIAVKPEKVEMEGIQWI
jgi:hypothetical protein